MKFGPYVVSALIALQFAHYPFTGDLAWLVGWAAQDVALCVMALFTYKTTSYAHPQTKGSFLVFFVYMVLSVITSFYGWTVESFGLWFVAIGIALLLPVLKLALLRNLKTDRETKKNYMYALSPIIGGRGVINMLRPMTFAAYGGRLIIAGDFIYTPHKGNFVKVRRNLVNLDDYMLLDTQEVLNADTTTTLDGMVGKRAIPFIRDCAALETKRSLESIVWDKICQRKA